jgi:FixJ family two-component response regulator
VRTPSRPHVYVVDDEAAFVDAIGLLLDAHGIPNLGFTSPRRFLRMIRAGDPGCILLDVRMPGLNGLEVQEALRRRACRHPVLFLTGHGDIPMAVRATRAGALDFLEKPVKAALLLSRVRSALNHDRRNRRSTGRSAADNADFDGLTPREREVAALLVQGLSSAAMARKLRLSVRTVEMHRLRLLRRLGVDNTARAVRMLVEAGYAGAA